MTFYLDGDDFHPSEEVFLERAGGLEDTIMSHVGCELPAIVMKILIAEDVISHYNIFCI